MIQVIIIIALIGYAFQVMQSTEDHMIFDFYKKWLSKLSKKGKFWHYIAKPLGLCVVCNTTWIGILYSYIYLKYDLVAALTVGVAAAGLVTLISVLSVYIKNHL